MPTICYTSIMYGPHPFWYKIVMVSGYFIGWFWIWGILNMCPKTLHTSNPDNKFFANWYNLMRSLRKYQMIYYVGMLIFCGKDVVWYYKNIWEGNDNLNYVLMGQNLFERMGWYQ